MTIDDKQAILARLADMAKASAHKTGKHKKSEESSAPEDTFVSNAKPAKAEAPVKAPKSKKATKETSEAKNPDVVRVNYLPQDPGMLPLQEADLVLRPDLTNDRFKLSESPTFKQPKADAEGNFLYTPDDTRFDGINAFFIANQTLNMAEKYAGRELPWSFSKELGRDQMIIHPHLLANEPNAFYSSETGSVNLSYYVNQEGATERTGTQADVIAHEAGHGILDSMRPTWLQSLSVASGGFHEAFGDMMSILRALNDDPVIPALKAETNGELRIPNLVSSVGEQIGTAIYGDKAEGGLRQALNKTKYADSAFLPFMDRDGSHEGLGTEPHAYSKLFTAAFYDILTGLYDEANADPDASFRSSIGQARDQAGRLLFRAVDFSPVGDVSYPEMAQSFLRADLIDNGGKNLELLAGVFINRKILSPEQIQSFVLQESATPELRYSEKLEKPEGALKFLDKHREELGIPADAKFEFQGLRTSKEGERFVTFTTQRDQLLEGKEWGLYEGAKLRSNGGALLAFDKSGKMLAAQYDPVSDDELEEARINFRNHLNGGSIVDSANKGDEKKNLHRLHIQTLSEGGSRVIRRAPVVYCATHGEGCSCGG